MNRDQYMSYDEMMRLRRYAEEHAHESKAAWITWLVVDMALQTGLRVCELTWIDFADLDFERGFIRVWRAKRSKPYRDMVPMTESLAEHLKAHMKWCEKKISYGLESIWPGQRGPMTTRGLQLAWQKVCAKVHVKLSIHGARHTIATHMLRQSHNLRMVQKQLGHTSPVTTAKFYADVPLEDMIKTLEGLFDERDGRA